MRKFILLTILILFIKSNTQAQTIDAWCEISFTVMGANYNMGPNNLILSLEGLGYSKSYSYEHGGYKLDDVTFPGVPVGESMRFTIFYNGKIRYSTTLKFTKPSFGSRAIKIAGYMGSYSCEIGSNGKVTYSSKY